VTAVLPEVSRSEASVEWFQADLALVSASGAANSGLATTNEATSTLSITENDIERDIIVFLQA
jgi:hypothetical protein